MLKLKCFLASTVYVHSFVVLRIIRVEVCSKNWIRIKTGLYDLCTLCIDIHGGCKQPVIGSQKNTVSLLQCDPESIITFCRRNNTTKCNYEKILGNSHPDYMLVMHRKCEIVKLKKCLIAIKFYLKHARSFCKKSYFFRGNRTCIKFVCSSGLWYSIVPLCI